MEKINLIKLNSNFHHPKFDVLRGCAALFVLFAHSCQVFIWRLVGDDHLISQISGMIARYAVIIFFLLSGYLITQSIFNNISKNQKFDVIDYLSARIARIYPPLIFAISITLVFWIVINFCDLPGGKIPFGVTGDKYSVRQFFSLSWETDIYNALTMDGGFWIANGPLWSLYIEFHIYIVAMLFAIAAIHKGWARTSAVIIGAILCWHWFGLDVSAKWLFFWIWAIGSALAIAERFGYRAKLKEKYRGAILRVVVMVVVATIYKPQIALISGTWFSGLYQLIVAVILSYIVFLSTWMERKFPDSIKSTADFSYTLYVTHFPLILFAYSISQFWIGLAWERTLSAMLSAMVVAIVLAKLSARYVENQRMFKAELMKAWGR